MDGALFNPATLCTACGAGPCLSLVRRRVPICPTWCFHHDRRMPPIEISYMYLVVGRRLLRVSSRCERTSGCRALSKPLPLVHPHIAVPRAGLRLPPFDRGLLASPCSSFSKCCYLGVECLLQGGYMASKVPALSVNSAMLPAGIGNYCRRSMFRTWQLAAGRERSWRVEG